MDSWQLNFFVDLNELCNDFEHSEMFGGMWAEDKADTPIKWSFTVPESGKIISIIFHRHDGNGVSVESSCVDALEAFIKTPVHHRLAYLVCEDWETELTVALVGEDDETTTYEEYRWDEDKTAIVRIK
jgi:hypothetical protein